MITLATEINVILRNEGYATWQQSDLQGCILTFENPQIVGFVFEFDTVNELLETWQDAERVVLSRFRSALRQAGEKAWNVYSVFLTQHYDPNCERAIDSIEEDFSMTRKIAAQNLSRTELLELALLPLLSLRSSPQLVQDSFVERLRSRLGDVPGEAVEAFLSGGDEENIARLLQVRT